MKKPAGDGGFAGLQSSKPKSDLICSQTPKTAQDKTASDG